MSPKALIFYPAKHGLAALSLWQALFFCLVFYTALTLLLLHGPKKRERKKLCLFRLQQKRGGLKILSLFLRNFLSVFRFPKSNSKPQYSLLLGRGGAFDREKPWIS